MDSSAKIYTQDFDAVLLQEHARIRAMRSNKKPAAANPAPGGKASVPDTDDFTGLAISGGGIRSAAFATGVLQGLVAGDLLRKMDYLSTVSGGGYIGTSLTWYLTRGNPNPSGATVPAGTTAANFPFGSGDIGGRTGPRRPALDFIRDHGKYLTPDAGLNLTSAISVVMRSMFTSLLAYLLMMCVLMVPMRWAHMFNDYSLSDLPNVGSELDWLPLDMNLLWWGAVALVVTLAIKSVLFSQRTAMPILYKQVQYAGLNEAQRNGGRMLTAILVLVVIGSLPYFHHWVQSVWSQILAAGISTVLGTALSAYEVLKKDDSGRFGTLRLVLGAVLLIYGLLQAGYFISAYVHDWRMLSGLAVTMLAIGGVVNINHMGIHRMYRDRLMEVFMPNPETPITGCWALATEADKAPLEAFCKETVAGPYHLINTNLVLTDSRRPKYRGRAGHSFLLSPLYCGSDATGWRHTEKYMKGLWSVLGSRGMTLATAMAISGAAANPNAGVAGRGITCNPIISALMTLLNLRLGYWAAHPKLESSGPFPPNFLVPGLRAGLFGRGLSETADNIELTDGGHFENLGLYELLRRRLRLIIVSDAAADPAYHFGDLSNALERARVDLGVEINFRSDYPLTDIVPGSFNRTAAQARVPYAGRAFAVADILYLNKQTMNKPTDAPDRGVLIYLKSTLTKGLTEDIYGYFKANPEFPNQPTSDQFFDEAQFEAYRELGYQLTYQMVKANQKEQWL